MTKPTYSQIDTLQLASSGPIRYYKGGYYTTPAIAGTEDQRTELYGKRVTDYTRTTTLRVCVRNGWLTDNGAANIYDRRWSITEAGRAVLKEQA